MEHCIKIGTFGLNRKHILGKIASGDKIVCCASKDWKIIGTEDAASDYYLDNEPVFLKDGIFPDRFNFTATQVPASAELDLKQIVDSLSFVTNLAYWAVYFRNGIVEISPQDWTLVLQRLKH